MDGALLVGLIALAVVATAAAIFLVKLAAERQRAEAAESLLEGARRDAELHVARQHQLEAQAQHLSNESDRLRVELEHARSELRDVYGRWHDDLREAATELRRVHHEWTDRIEGRLAGPEAGGITGRKLHHNEGDELEGVTPEKVAADASRAAGAVKAAERFSTLVDEIATREGVEVGPLPSFDEGPAA